MSCPLLCWGMPMLSLQNFYVFPALDHFTDAYSQLYFRHPESNKEFESSLYIPVPFQVSSPSKSQVLHLQNTKTLVTNHFKQHTKKHPKAPHSILAACILNIDFNRESGSHMKKKLSKKQTNNMSFCTCAVPCFKLHRHRASGTSFAPCLK